MLKIFLITIAILIALIVGWHFAFFLLGGVILVTSTVWAIIIGSVAAFCAAIMALFIVTGAGIFVLGTLAAIWTILAILAFPIVFPILVPLFVILLFLGYSRRKDLKKNKQDSNSQSKQI